MSFHNVSLPDDFQYASTFGAGFATVTQETASGHEFRIARQAQPRHRYRLRKALQSQTEAAALKQFGIGRRGALHTWRLKDWSDYSSASDGVSAQTNLDCVLGTGDGTETQFQLSKTYDATGTSPYVRTITLPVSSSTLVAVAGVSKTEGVDYTVSEPGGVITFGSAPTAGQVVTAGFTFDVPVRFESGFDSWNGLRADAYDVWALTDFDCVEELSAVESPELWFPGGGKDWETTSVDVSMTFAQGELHLFDPTTPISAYLPAPPTGFVGGPRVFVVSLDSGSSGVQLRDDSGTAVGSQLTSGMTRSIGCLVSGGTVTWVVY